MHTPWTDIPEETHRRMAKEKKWYVVWRGRAHGLFDTWEECQAQVHGYPGAQYMAFSSRREAETALEHSYELARTQPVDFRVSGKNAPMMEAIAVDASCIGNPGPVEFRGVHIGEATEIFRQGPYANGTNNIGEFLAIVHALAYLHRQNESWPVYSDSEIAIGWVSQTHCRTKLKVEDSNAALFALIRKAESWLRSNEFHNPIIKWETEDWGENPADYHRK
jgi:ribonuclease HI